MALLHLVEKEQSTGRVAEIYETMTQAMGFVPNAFKLYSSSPFLLEQQFRNLGYYMRHEKLGGKLLAFIRLLVSDQETCAYCVGVNTGILFQYGVLPEAIEAIRKDPSSAPLEEKELGMLLFVLKMMKDSNSIEAGDVDHLRKLGWSDQEILEGSFHGASQVASDKLLNGFKIQLDR